MVLKKHAKSSTRRSQPRRSQPRRSQPRSDRRGRKKAAMQGGAITKLTEVQARCLAPGIAGSDIVAKSSTGSGKSLAFLMVAIERILKHGGPDPSLSFPVVILTPVTDLATQIMKVAASLLKHHAPMVADVVIGGTSESNDLRRLSSSRIDVLVATPGRFKSLLNDRTVQERLARCQTFVIDEADKLTDPGFLRDTQYIHSKANNPNMQTLMFSATLDRAAISKTGLVRETAEYIDAVTATTGSLVQNVIVCNVASYLDAVISVINDQIGDPKKQQGGNASLDVNDHDLSQGTLAALSEWPTPRLTGYRIMCFLSSNAFVDYFAKAVANVLPSLTTFVLHGNLPQHKRSKVSEAFRNTDNCVLFTSDASARGVDYPDVTCVIQLGYDSRAEYLQRAGRTGRAGKSGESFLVMSLYEVSAASQLCDVINNTYIDRSIDAEMCKRVDSYSATGIEFPRSLNRDAKHAFRGWLGSLASKWKRLKMSKEDVLSYAQDMSRAMHLGEQDVDKLKQKLHL